MDMSGGQAPFYMQLREIVRYKIETGEYAPCTALPSENELADTFSCHTAQKSLIHQSINGVAHCLPGGGKGISQFIF